MRYEGKRQHTLYLSMGSADQDVLNRFALVVGGHIRGPYRGQGSKTPEHYKPIYQWQIAGFHAACAILKAFWPYLGERRKAKATEAVNAFCTDPYKRMPQRRNGRSAQVLIGA